MDYRFRIHYTKEKAEALLPELREWLNELETHRTHLSKLENRLEQFLATGQDMGGEIANDWVRTLASMKRIFREFQTRDIQLKDLDRGLIDFPAIVGGREVFLCWEKDEDAIDYWHDLDSGVAGREPLD